MICLHHRWWPLARNCGLGKHPASSSRCSAKAVKRSNPLIAAEKREKHTGHARTGWGEDYYFRHLNPPCRRANCSVENVLQEREVRTVFFSYLICVTLSSRRIPAFLHNVEMPSAGASDAGGAESPGVGGGWPACSETGVKQIAWLTSPTHSQKAWILECTDPGMHKISLR